MIPHGCEGVIVKVAQGDDVRRRTLTTLDSFEELEQVASELFEGDCPLPFALVYTLEDGERVLLGSKKALRTIIKEASKETVTVHQLPFCVLRLTILDPESDDVPSLRADLVDGDDDEEEEEENFGEEIEEEMGGWDPVEDFEDVEESEEEEEKKEEAKENEKVEGNVEEEKQKEEIEEQQKEEIEEQKEEIEEKEEEEEKEDKKEEEKKEEKEEEKEEGKEEKKEEEEGKSLGDRFFGLMLGERNDYQDQTDQEDEGEGDDGEIEYTLKELKEIPIVEEPVERAGEEGRKEGEEKASLVEGAGGATSGTVVESEQAAVGMAGMVTGAMVTVLKTALFAPFACGGCNKNIMQSSSSSSSSSSSTAPPSQTE
eukprot:CAMPEP_0201522416 /NCGR_PEP_ID=MMETSP0161_2-20130828/17300_1 /ASSEMBLY_ACC=CAM_ASM_000251 /TAXON_ID=180227 /ORGANISM="Neoparamoeba aestuarina, Strain SoJaBio B1-5/56/2" /LENGTH=370 /DNA_ID=CAMNT_0047921251 /DNA_START=70 /DNA_END=1182 /DNA_ORIENTATION=+